MQLTPHPPLFRCRAREGEIEESVWSEPVLA
jgi:hypothetical protein